METELLRKRRSEHFDTTRDQISTRKSVLARNILEVSAKAKEQKSSCMNMKSGCLRIQDKIRLYNMQITENEQKIQKLQEELNVQTGKIECRTRQHITERHPGWNH